MASVKLLSLLIQFSDSAFPVGTFSFSNGLETAGYEGLVHDAASLEEYARSCARQGAYTDGVAALESYRAALRGDFEAIKEIDAKLYMSKMNDETRLMLQRMGKKLAELLQRLLCNDITDSFLTSIQKEEMPGCFPVAQGIAFAIAGMSEEELFASHQYGIVNMVCSAALRTVRVSHYDTQKILYKLASEAEGLYNHVKDMNIDEIHTFVPEVDILASLHEKGTMRMFMS